MLRFANLDKLRGFAALSVVLYHVIEHTKWQNYPTTGPLVWGRVGWMGVDLFFVISGLVITYSAWTLRAKYADAWRHQFWLRRLTRIAPLYLFTILVFVCFIEPIWLSVPLKQLGLHLLTHALFIHNLFPSTHGSLNGANWSIGTEMQFYLLVALIFPWLLRIRLTVLVVVLFAVAWGWRSAMFGWIGAGNIPEMFHFTTQLPGTLDQFALGILLCKMMADTHHAQSVKWLQQNPLHVIGASSVLIALMWIIFWRYAGNYWDNVWMVVFFRSLIGLAACSLILSVMIWPWAAPRWIAAPLDFLGTISYGLYLWHLPVILTLQRSGTQPGISFLCKTVVLTIVLATASYYLFEKLWMRRAHAISPASGAPSS